MLRSVFLCLICAAASPALYSSSDAEVDQWLRAQAATGRPFDVRLHLCVDAALGTPYKDGPLGEGPGGKYDKDPLIDLQHVDCVTFVEQSIALAASQNLASATDLLQKIRYKEGKIDFGARNHFFISDWMKNNSWCKDVTGTLGVETLGITRTIDRAAFFRKVKAPEVGQDIPPQQDTIHYIPAAQAEQAESKIPDGSIVVFVGKIDWLFALHCGLVMQGENGPLLYHASSQAGKVAAVDFGDYVNSQSNRYLGFVVNKAAEPK